MRKTIIVALVAMLTVGCASTGEQNGRIFGALGGAAGGAAIGNLFDCQGCALIGGIIGGLAGGYAGGEMGRRMDEHDAMMTHRAVNTAPTGHRTAWSNPDTGMQYDVTPTRTYRSQQTGDFCREVTIGQAEVGGKRQEVYGTACRQPDGSWKIQQ